MANSSYSNIHPVNEILRNLAVEAIPSDGQLHTAIWKSFDVLMDCVEQQEWLEWYIYDNDCGAAKMKAGFNEVVNPIKNSRDLAKLIVEDGIGMTDKPYHITDKL